MKILCITPIQHLDGVYEKLESCGEVIYEPNITKQKLKILLDRSGARYLFTNPNKQNFILDKEVLQFSFLDKNFIIPLSSVLTVGNLISS